MSFIDWFKSLYSRRAKSLLSYRRGMQMAKQGDFKGAISYYTDVIEAGNVPNDVLGMALFNRGLAYSALHETEMAAADLTQLLGMQGLPENIKVAAAQRRERLRRRE